MYFVHSFRHPTIIVLYAHIYFVFYMLRSDKYSCLLYLDHFQCDCFYIVLLIAWVCDYFLHDL